MRELGRRTEAAKVAFHENQARFTPSIQEAPADQPLVIVQRSGQRMTISAACPVAAAMGLEVGMPVTQARVLVPGLQTLDADPEADAAVLMRLALFAARRWTPRAAVSGEDGLWLDLTGVSHLFGGERAFCVRILRFCARFGFSARIAVASTPGAAHALARHGTRDIILCPDGDERQALAPLPLSALRVEAEVVSAARRLGLEAVADLLGKPRAPLERRFGRSLLLRLDQALGRAGEAIEPVVPVDPPNALVRLLEPISTAEAIEEGLRRLLAMLIDRLEKAGLAARKIVLLCTRVDGEEQRISIGTSRGSRDGAHFLTLFRQRIERIEPGFGIEAMRLVAVRCEPLGAVPFEGVLSGDPPPPDLAPLIDRLSSRLGPRGLFRVSAVESDVPERSLKRVPPLEGTSDWPPEWPRPARLLSRPEPLSNVVALLPDGAPRRFTWRGTAHVVRQADGPERIYGEWWKRRAEAEAVRDYFQVEDEDGARFWIFRRGDGVDGRTGDLSWYMHGVFG